MEELAKCPLCNSDRLLQAMDVVDHFLSKESFQLVDCAVCGLRSTSPRPSTKEMGRYYQSAGYLSHSNRTNTFKARLYRSARKLALRSKFNLVHRLASSGRVLDIGCGTGEFLAYLMNRGYQVEGVEPDPGARAQAIADHGIPVLPSFDQIPTGEQFNTVTLWHVLEHVPDLRGTMKRVHSCLKNGGYLIVAVPNMESWDAQHYGPFWAAWDVPRHLTHFKNEDLERLLDQHGFDLVSMRPMWLDAFYIALLSEEYRGRSKAIAFLRAVFVGAWSDLKHIISSRPTSSTIYIARKANA